MRREQQQAQVQMALQLLQMLREGRQQDEKLALMREQMRQEGRMGRRQMRLGMEQAQNRNLLEREKLEQDARQFELQQQSQEAQIRGRNEGLMNPQILEYLQGVAMMPAGPDKDALMANLENLTGKKFVRPVNQFEQLVKGK